MAAEAEPMAWSSGNFKGIGAAGNVVITRESVKMEKHPDIKMTFSHGEFGEADPEVVEALGRKSYNLESKYSFFGTDIVEYGVVSKDGKRIMVKTGWGLWDLTWMSKEEAERLANDGDPVSCPPSHYKLEPERQGKLLWVSGPPGSGKSTLAQLLSRHHGFVYYEGDCFFQATNPYVPSDVENPSLAFVTQRKLVGEGVKERKEASQKGQKEMEVWVMGGEPDWTVLETGFRMMCQDVARERRRMGGDWVVAGVLFNRRLRDLARLSFPIIHDYSKKSLPCLQMPTYERKEISPPKNIVCFDRSDLSTRYSSILSGLSWVLSCAWWSWT